MPAASSSSVPAALTRLARACGVLTSYIDMRGVKQTASPEALMAVLRALGMGPLDSPRDARPALREWEQRHWSTPIGPVAALWEGERPHVTLRRPAREAAEPVPFEIFTEQGERIIGSAHPGAPEPRSGVSLGAERYVRVPCALGVDLPLGYHTLHVTTRAGTFQTLLIHAPAKVYRSRRRADRRAWGAFLPLYALRSARDAGAGDLTDLEALMDWLRGLGGTVVSTLPLLAAFLGETGGAESAPFEPSPYTPASRLFWNELYVDPTRAPEFEACGLARALVESADYEVQRDGLAEEPLVD